MTIDELLETIRAHGESIGLEHPQVAAIDGPVFTVSLGHYVDGALQTIKGMSFECGREEALQKDKAGEIITACKAVLDSVLVAEEA